MKIYIVLWQDRHTDITAKPFLNFEEARAWAIAQPEHIGVKKRFIKETPVNGWLFHIEYSVESDCLWITEHELEGYKGGD